MSRRLIEKLRNSARLEALKQLETDGEIRPSDLVEAARIPSHPYHDSFEWDDSKAAAKHRLEQARVIIRAVKPYLVEDGAVIRAPVYVRNPERQVEEQGYIRLAKAKTQEDVAVEVFQAELSRAISALKRACDVGNVLGFGTEIKGYISGLEAIAHNARSVDAVAV